jgi:hypothetical protein
MFGNTFAMPTPTRPCSYCEGTGKEFDPVGYGVQMRRTRVKAGLKLREVARRMKVGPSHVCDLEKGRRPWSKAVIAKYKEALK